MASRRMKTAKAELKIPLLVVVPWNIRVGKQGYGLFNWFLVAIIWGFISDISLCQQLFWDCEK